MTRYGGRGWGRRSWTRNAPRNTSGRRQRITFFDTAGIYSVDVSDILAGRLLHKVFEPSTAARTTSLQ